MTGTPLYAIMLLVFCSGVLFRLVAQFIFPEESDNFTLNRRYYYIRSTSLFTRSSAECCLNQNLGRTETHINMINLLTTIVRDC